MKKLFLFLSLAFTLNANAQDEKTVTLTVSGQGATQDEARQKALRSAIEQAFGTFISSKTEILNDNLVKDEIVSVANGNIQKFEILNETQLPNAIWATSLKVNVSVEKLTSFVQAKGINIEIKSGLFAMNIKQQLLNEQGEVNAITEMVGLLHETIQTAFDYKIKSSEPKALDNESKNWEIPLEVTATCNQNIDFCANYCIKTLAALSLSSEEVKSYQSLNKVVFPVVINYKKVEKTFYLRKQPSINALLSFVSNWEYYTRLFTVQSGMDELNGNGEGSAHDIGEICDRIICIKINFLTAGKQAAIFSWQDKRTLSQIEQMTGYIVKPRGVVSQFKHGGFVVFEKDGLGLVAAITDLGYMNWSDAKLACEELMLNGYSDWRLPSKEELEIINNNFIKTGLIAGFSEYPYWSSTQNNDYALPFRFGYQYIEGLLKYEVKYKNEYSVRAVRTFYY